MNDFIGDNQCVTHHNACDCREAYFAKIEAKLAKLKLLDLIEPQIINVGSWIVCPFRNRGNCNLRRGGWCYDGKYEDRKKVFPPGCPLVNDIVVKRKKRPKESDFPSSSSEE